MTPEFYYMISDSLANLSHGEQDLLVKFCRELPPWGTVVNLGAGNGCSAAAILSSRPDLTLFSVDAQKESHPLGSLDGEMVSLKRCGLVPTDRLHQIHHNSQDWHLPDNIKADIVFVDACHDEIAVRADFANWVPQLKAGGVLMFHDWETTGGFLLDLVKDLPLIALERLIRVFRV
jgi:predicted O-methyltransferase YrrM